MTRNRISNSHRNKIRYDRIGRYRKAASILGDQKGNERTAEDIVLSQSKSRQARSDSGKKLRTLTFSIFILLIFGLPVTAAIFEYTPGGNNPVTIAVPILGGGALIFGILYLLISVRTS